MNRAAHGTGGYRELCGDGIAAGLDRHDIAEQLQLPRAVVVVEGAGRSLLHAAVPRLFEPPQS